MELSNYEVIRYPSGQFVITRLDRTASGAVSSGPRDVIGAYATEQEAQTALHRLTGTGREGVPDIHQSSTALRT